MLDSWLQLGTGLVYEKEILPVGQITRWVNDAKDVLNANIKREFLDRLVTHFKKFKEVGVRVPVFKTHHEDPSNKRGQVEDIYVKPNSRGQDSLHAKISFDNEAAVELAMANDVSALIPPKFVDGRGNHYDWPLRHVAITATPVLPGLDNWSGPMVLAFSTGSGVPLSDDGKGGIDVDKVLNALGEELSLDFSGTDDQATKLEMILDAVKILKSRNVELSLSHNDNDDEVELSFPPVLVKHLRTARMSQIDALREGNTISLSLAQKLEKDYCSERALQFDLSLTDDETQFDRDVELIKLVAKDRPLANSGRQTLKLSHGQSNPLLDDAKKRAEAKKVS